MNSSRESTRSASPGKRRSPFAAAQDLPADVEQEFGLQRPLQSPASAGLTMQSLTIEYQRFGDPTGVIRLSDRYIRTLGTTTPTEEVGFELSQENLDLAMAALDYGRFEYADDLEKVRHTAEHVLIDLAPYMRRFLLGKTFRRGARQPCQIDIVARPLELAQLPFEVLEEFDPNLVVTRRIRQPWPMPETVRDNIPKVLFVWAEPARRPGSRRRMEVPHERHRELLRALLHDWGNDAIVEVANATAADLVSALAGGARFTHVHLLAHGVGPDSHLASMGERIDLTRKLPSTNCLALENPDGSIDRFPPEKLAALFETVPRPETFVIATCHSAEVDPIRSGGTVAHALHAAGVPVVLASQLALTVAGSDVLIDTFLAAVIDGIDPREALRAARDQLRESSETTYYDRVALVGYVHIDDGLTQRLRQRRFEVALQRLKRISQDADRRTESAIIDLDRCKALTPEQFAEAGQIRQRFGLVRNRLNELEHDHALTKAQREELHGLQASAMKREAEAAWKLGRVLPGANAQDWLEHSHGMLREAASAYRRAAEISRDHHWTWVQWLVLEAVQDGTLSGSKTDWITAKAAACDAASRKAARGTPGDERRLIAKEANWAWGSLIELDLLAPLAGYDDALDHAKRAARALVKAARRRRDPFAIDSTLAQLTRYREWWGADPEWKLPTSVVQQARELEEHLRRLSQDEGL